ncbi:MAG: hypothetical protein FIA97_01550 [Methylococcaceae bacterium]|nr:hypothetical protein [Methylococcaceae bacterium]
MKSASTLNRFCFSGAVVLAMSRDAAWAVDGFGTEVKVTNLGPALNGWNGGGAGRCPTIRRSISFGTASKVWIDGVAKPEPSVSTTNHCGDAGADLVFPNFNKIRLG